MRFLIFLFSIFLLILSVPGLLLASGNCQDLVCSISLVDVWTWCLEHWVVIALILSELLAVLPGKWSGIIQSIIKLGNALFTKKNG